MPPFDQSSDNSSANESCASRNKITFHLLKIFVSSHNLHEKSYIYSNHMSQTPPKKLIVYGITGLLGSRIWQLCSPRFKIIGPPHTLLNLADFKRVKEHINDTLPDRIIYVAGLTKVDEAEKNPKLAYKLNFEIPAKIASFAKKKRIPLLYVSTDAIFDGRKYDRAYTERDKPNPISVYGKSKLAGEQAIISASATNLILRTIMLYSANYPHKKDFARTAYESLKNHQTFTAIADQIINPTFVDDFVNAMTAAIEKNARGIYHVAAIDHTTNLGFVKKIAKIFNFNKNLITKTYFDEFFQNKPAPRTKYCRLDTTKFQKQFKGILKSTEQSLAEFKKQIESVESEPISL